MLYACAIVSLSPIRPIFKPLKAICCLLLLLLFRILLISSICADSISRRLGIIFSRDRRRTSRRMDGCNLFSEETFKILLAASHSFAKSGDEIIVCRDGLGKFIERFLNIRIIIFFELREKLVSDLVSREIRGEIGFVDAI